MDLDNKTLWNDYRIAQPLNDRVVESSFLPRLGKGSGCYSTLLDIIFLQHKTVISHMKLLLVFFSL